MTTFSNIEFKEAIPFATDCRMVVKLDKKTHYTKGKAYYLSETVSNTTEKKSTRIVVNDLNKKTLHLEIVHGLNENIENVFNYVSKLKYAGIFGLLSIMMPFLLYIFGLLIYLFVKMFSKEQMFFSSEEYLNIALTAALAMCLFIILLIVYLKKDTLEATFEEEDQYDIPVDYTINDEPVNRNVTIFVGETWHVKTHKKKFPRKTAKALFQNEISSRENIINTVRNRRIQLEKLFTQILKLKDERKSKSRIYHSKKTDKGPAGQYKEEKEEIDALSDRLDALEKLYDEQKETLKQYIKDEAQPEINRLEDAALANWEETTKKLKIREAEKIQTKHFLRTNERIIELEAENSDLKIRSSLKDEQISEMRSLAISSTDAIKDVSIAATPEGRSRLFHQRVASNETSSKININWNKLITIILLSGVIIALGLIANNVMQSAADMGTKSSFFWSLFGIICVLGISMIVFIFASFVRPFYIKQTDVKIK